MEILLFSISALPVIIIGWFVWYKDKEKEPKELLAKLFCGGVLSCFLVFALTFGLRLFFPFFGEDMSTLNLFQLMISVFIGIALVEEVSKWLFTYKMSYNDREFDHIYDAIVYAVFVALGFAFYENLLYVFSGGMSVGFMRTVTAVPAHASFGVIMGYYLGLAKQSTINKRLDLAKKYKIMSIIAPTLLHGLYNYCIFTERPLFILLFFVVLVGLYALSFKKINQLTSINRKMQYKDNFCPNCGQVVDSCFCPYCGKKHN